MKGPSNEYTGPKGENGEKFSILQAMPQHTTQCGNYQEFKTN